MYKKQLEIKSPVNTVIWKKLCSPRWNPIFSFRHHNFPPHFNVVFFLLSSHELVKYIIGLRNISGYTKYNLWFALLHFFSFLFLFFIFLAMRLHTHNIIVNTWAKTFLLIHHKFFFSFPKYKKENKVTKRVLKSFLDIRLFCGF